MTPESRYRRALERIANHEIRGPVDEWSEAAAYGEVKDIALEALEPGTMAARRKAEQEIEQLDRERAKQLCKESSAGKRHFASHVGGCGSIVCVTGRDRARVDIVEVKVVETACNNPRCPWAHEHHYPGKVFTMNIHNIYDSQEDALAHRHPWGAVKENP